MTKCGVYMACRSLYGSVYMKLLWWLKNNCPKFNQNMHIRCTLPSYFILLCIFNQLLIVLIPYVHVYMPYFGTERTTHALFLPSKARKKNTCVSGGLTDPTQRPPTGNFFFFQFDFCQFRAMCFIQSRSLHFGK